MLGEGVLQFYIETADHMISLAMGPYLELVGGASDAILSGKYHRTQSVYISLS